MSHHSSASTNGSAWTSDDANPHLLVVEDHESTRIFLQHVLSTWYQIDVASGAEEGIRKAEEGRYDGFLIDIALRSSRDGIDVLDHLRSLKRYQQTPIVAVTAYAMPGDREQFLEAGFDAYLSKPFFRDDLLTMLDRFFDHRSKKVCD